MDFLGSSLPGLLEQFVSLLSIAVCNRFDVSLLFQAD